MACAQTLAWIARADRSAQITASVCTGAFLLAASGVRWVDQGRVVTSAGISAGIDMSLHLVARLAGTALAERTARQMDFQWIQA